MGVFTFLLIHPRPPGDYAAPLADDNAAAVCHIDHRHIEILADIAHYLVDLAVDTDFQG